MTTRYLYHGGNGSAGTAFAPGMAGAYANMAAVKAAFVAGDDIAIAHDNLENFTAAETFAFPASVQTPGKMYTINRTTGNPDKATLAAPQFTCSPTFGINWGGGISEFRGLAIQAGGGMSQTGVGSVTLGTAFGRTTVHDCQVELPNNVGSRWIVSGTEVYVERPVIKNGSGNGILQMVGTHGNHVKGDGGSIWGTGNVIPSSPTQTTVSSNRTIFEALNFLAHTGAGKSLGAFNATVNTFNIFIACDIHSGYAKTVGSSFGHHGNGFDLIGCVDEAGNLMMERHRMPGAVQLNTTVTRVGGANDGSNPFSYKISTTSLCFRHIPLRSFEQTFDVPDAMVGQNVTATIFLCYDSGATSLNDGELWAILSAAQTINSAVTELQYSGVGNPIQTPGNLVDDTTSTWNGTSGFGTLARKKLVFNFIPRRKGPHKVQLCCGKTGAAATTLTTQCYVDPAPALALV